MSLCCVTRLLKSLAASHKRKAEPLANAVVPRGEMDRQKRNPSLIGGPKDLGIVAESG